MRKFLLPTLAVSAMMMGAPVRADPSPPPPGMDPSQSASVRADDMALLLGLRPDQRPALDQFLGATMPPPHTDGDERRGPPDAAMMEARMDAAQRFRAGLTSDQQMRFDALERLRHGMGGHRRWGGGRPD